MDHWGRLSYLSLLFFGTLHSDGYIFPLSLVAQRIKRLPAMQETPVWSLGQEDTLEKEMVTYSYILIWRIPGTEEPGRLQTLGSQGVRHDWSDLAWVPLRDEDSLQGGLSRPVSRWLSASYPSPTFHHLAVSSKDPLIHPNHKNSSPCHPQTR